MTLNLADATSASLTLFFYPLASDTVHLYADCRREMLSFCSMSAAFTWFGVRREAFDISTFEKAFCLGFIGFLADATVNVLVLLVLVLLLLDAAVKTTAG